mmetsp:Transcript_6596/g.12183  ORF Transcript_6596/g.12183 Transcript_6596/m.12183 type:complete len:255 (+) Transcript_6596:669-1433(+)
MAAFARAPSHCRPQPPWRSRPAAFSHVPRYAGGRVLSAPPHYRNREVHGEGYGVCDPGSAGTPLEHHAAAQSCGARWGGGFEEWQGDGQVARQAHSAQQRVCVQLGDMGEAAFAVSQKQRERVHAQGRGQRPQVPARFGEQARLRLPASVSHRGAHLCHPEARGLPGHPGRGQRRRRGHEAQVVGRGERGVARRDRGGGRNRRHDLRRLLPSGQQTRPACAANLQQACLRFAQGFVQVHQPQRTIRAAPMQQHG